MKKSVKYRNNQQTQSFFEAETTLETLSKMGNVLDFIANIIDFEMFRTTLENSLQTQERKSNAGRPPIDPVLMFKVMFLQRLYGLSDEPNNLRERIPRASSDREPEKLQQREIQGA